MHRVYQKHTDCDHPERGDCFSACIAALLELPLEAVPFFNSPTALDSIGDLQLWLQKRGLSALWVALASPDARLCARLAVGTYFIAHGDSPRGNWQHAVIGRYTDEGEGWEMVHDPNPEGGGIKQLRRLTFIGLLEPWTYI